MAHPSVPVIDISAWVLGERDSAAVKAACLSVAESLRETGALVVRDPRVSEADNAAFLDMVERYFAQPREAKMKDVRAELSYQVGATPDLVELPLCAVDADCAQEVAAQPLEHRATMPTGPDPKWRYMWRIGPRPPPERTAFSELNAAPVVPEAFPEWPEMMDRWGTRMVEAVVAVAQMAAVGWGLPEDAFSGLMQNGPHLLAPTGSDLNEYKEEGFVFAGFHSDLNLLTIHGKARFPGLHIWLRNGRRVSVAVPEGCLLLQAGKQLEYLTGGHVKAGMHEVLLSEATLQAAEAAKAKGHCLWRVSSTLFAHVQSDQILRPLGRFAQEEGAAGYEPVTAGAFCEKELSAIKLKAPDGT
jgi:isopenicillin N synthase-like dioxygenase